MENNRFKKNLDDSSFKKKDPRGILDDLIDKINLRQLMVKRPRKVLMILKLNYLVLKVPIAHDRRYKKR